MRLDVFIKTAMIYFKARITLEITSGPGVGKSSAMHEIAANLSRQMGVPIGVTTQILSSIESVDARGFLMPMKGDNGEFGARFTNPAIFPFPWNTDVYVNGELDPNWAGPVPEYGILFLDEFGQASVDVQKPMGQLLLDHRIGDHKLPSGWVVWAASNRVEDRSGVVKRLAFLQNRILTLEIEPSYDAWEGWAVTHGVHPLIVSFAKRHQALVFRDTVPKEPGAFCTPRSLVMTGNALAALRTEAHGDQRLPDDDVALQTVRGYLGDGTQPQFMSHIRLANDLPDIEDVIKDPLKTKVPDRVDARYVMATTLAYHVSQKTAGAFIKYISRFDKELQILFISVATHRHGGAALMTPEFHEWVSNNVDLSLIAFQ